MTPTPISEQMVTVARASRASQQARDDRLARIPWVTRLSGPVSCDGVKWGQVALKHLYSKGDRPAEGIPDRAFCQLNAKWHFEAMSDVSSADTGNYCVRHLPIHDCPEERERFNTWVATQRNFWPWPDDQPPHDLAPDQ